VHGRSKQPSIPETQISPVSFDLIGVNGGHVRNIRNRSP
jgi:hypothetical protein